MQLKKDAISLDDEKLVAVLDELRADLTLSHVDCTLLNEKEFYKEDRNLRYCFTEVPNVITHIMIHESEPTYGARLVCSNIGSTLLKPLADHINKKVVINLNNIIQCLNQAIDILKSVIADEPKNRSDWPTIKHLFSNTNNDLVNSMLSAEEQQKIEQQIAEQEQKLILLKAKLVEHLAVIKSLQKLENQPSSPRIQRDSPILAPKNEVVATEEVQSITQSLL